MGVQTIDPASVWELVKTLLGWLAALGIVIDLTPGLKFQPVRWLLSRLGNLINADIKKQLDGLQQDFTDFKVDAWRQNECGDEPDVILHVVLYLVVFKWIQKQR